MKKLKATIVFALTFLVYHFIGSQFFPVGEHNVLQIPDWYISVGLVISAIVTVFFCTTSTKKIPQVSAPTTYVESPAPQISEPYIQFVQTTLNQISDTLKIVNTTVKPDIFFKRLNFLLDLLLRLQPYEKYGFFKTESPTAGYKRIAANLEVPVDAFIDRAVLDNQQKILRLKTERAKQKCYVDFACALISAFDCANTFWVGDKGFPHHSGPLFTEKNYARVQSIWDEACSEKYDYDIDIL